MSLLLRDRLFVGLAPEQLSALRIGGSLRPKIQERHTQTLPSTTDSQWDAVIAALEILLEQPKWAGCNVTVVLSNHFVQYVVLPKSEGLSANEQTDLAQLIFRNTFGELSDEWELRISRSGTQSTLASGVPRTLLSALHAACEGRGILFSIQPGLMPIFNALQRQSECNDGALVVVERGRISSAVISNGQWATILGRSGQGNALFPFLEEECFLQGRQSGGVLWLSDLTGEVHFPPDSPWKTLPLKPSHANPDGVPSLADWGYS